MVEHAQEGRSMDALTRSLSHANPAIVRAINAKRRAMGLPEVRTAGDPSTPLTTIRSDGTRHVEHTPESQASRLAVIRARAAVAAGELRAAGHTNIDRTARRCS